MAWSSHWAGQSIDFYSISLGSSFIKNFKNCQGDKNKTIFGWSMKMQKFLALDQPDRLVSPIFTFRSTVVGSQEYLVFHDVRQWEIDGILSISWPKQLLSNPYGEISMPLVYLLRVVEWIQYPGSINQRHLILEELNWATKWCDLLKKWLTCHHLPSYHTSPARTCLEVLSRPCCDAPCPHEAYEKMKLLYLQFLKLRHI